MLRLLPWQFAALTPAECVAMLHAVSEEHEHFVELLAWHAANVMNVHLKPGKHVTVMKLLGRPTLAMRRQAEQSRKAAEEPPDGR